MINQRRFNLTILFVFGSWLSVLQSSHVYAQGVCGGDGVVIDVNDNFHYSARWSLELPEGQDEISCQVTGEFSLSDSNEYFESSDRVLHTLFPISFVYHGHGDGPFEAFVDVEYILDNFTTGVSRYPSARTEGWHVNHSANGDWPLAFIGSQFLEATLIGEGIIESMAPTMLDTPDGVSGAISRWQNSRLFSEQTLGIVTAYIDRLIRFSAESMSVWEVDHYDLTMNVTMTLRRVRSQCYMRTTVSGGPGAGVYAGDVAVLSDNPTGIQLDTVREMWFSGPDAYQERIARMQQSPAMRRMMENMSSSDRAAMEANQAAMAAAMAGVQGSAANAGEIADPNPGRDVADLIEGDEPSRGSDPLAELEGMWTLTLEDVRFDDRGPSAGDGVPEEMAMAYIASKFVLSALLDGDSIRNQGPVQEGERPLGMTLGVSQMGLKGPGLGLASTRAEGCTVPAPNLRLEPCPGEQWQSLDRMGAFCGTLSGQVCHESGDTLTVNAEFLAASTLEDCIR